MPAFDTPSPERSYWLGFIMADGCIMKGSRRDSDTPVLSVALMGSDAGHLVKLSIFLGSDMPVRMGTYMGGMDIGMTDRAAVRYPSHGLVESLRALGVTERKSGRERVPTGFEDDRDLWRGWVDGDGWVLAPRSSPTGYGGFIVGLCGSWEVCDAFARYGASVVGGSPPTVKPNASIWSVAFCSARAVGLMRHFYQDSCVSLDRKKEKALELVARYETIKTGRLARQRRRSAVP